MIIDDNKYNIYEKKNKYKNINFIQIENNICKSKKYFNLTTCTIKKDVTGWDKALYYFTFINNNFNNVWFIEDDVYFYNENILKIIDKEYKSSDFLSKKFKYCNKYWYHWKSIDIKFKSPHYFAMCCIIRCSNKLIKCIKKYIDTYEKLEFLEYFFPPVANKNNLICNTPKYFDNIYWNKSLLLNNIQDLYNCNKNNFYHPIKNINIHKKLRKL